MTEGMGPDARRYEVARSALAAIRDRGCSYRRPLGECFLSQRPEATWCASCLAKKAIVQAEAVK